MEFTIFKGDRFEFREKSTAKRYIESANLSPYVLDPFELRRPTLSAISNHDGQRVMTHIKMTRHFESGDIIGYMKEA